MKIVRQFLLGIILSLSGAAAWAYCTPLMLDLGRDGFQLGPQGVGEEQNAWLAHWEERWAAPRIHGRKKRQVLQMFLEERPFRIRRTVSRRPLIVFVLIPSARRWAIIPAVVGLFLEDALGLQRRQEDVPQARPRTPLSSSVLGTAQQDMHASRLARHEPHRAMSAGRQQP